MCLGASLAVAPALTKQAQPPVEYLNHSKPSVYITFDRWDVPPKDGRPAHVWLRLHNNTRWRLRIPLQNNSQPRSDRLIYRVIPAESFFFPTVAGVVIGGSREAAMPSPQSYAVNAENIILEFLEPGVNWRFRVPAEGVAQGVVLLVPFNYGWEDETKIRSGTEPYHFAILTSHSVRSPE
jgi:hypothetical protein